MEKMRAMMLTLDTFLMGIWGLTIVDLLYLFNIGGFSFLDDAIKLLLALAGLVYLVAVKIPSEYKNAKLNQRIKIAEAKKIEMENKSYEKDHPDNSDS